jgi:hypothetical protein
MKRNILYIIVMNILMLFILSSCQKDDYKLGELITPTNLTLDYEIVGADSENPNGDGSGIVNFTASANNALSFIFDFGDGRDTKAVPGGDTSNVYTKSGTNTYDVIVSAIGTGGLSLRDTFQVEVYVLFEDNEIVDLITGGSSKSWYWDATNTGHIGLGPNNLEGGPEDHYTAAWWNAAPWEKIDADSSMYQAEFVFTKVGDGVTFEHINPTSKAFFLNSYANKLGLGDEGIYEWDISGINDVSFGPASSIATEDGGYRGTSFNISDGGFMGWYCGSSDYEIIQVTENTLEVRVLQPDTPVFAWYHVFTTENPMP